MVDERPLSAAELFDAIGTGYETRSGDRRWWTVPRRSGGAPADPRPAAGLTDRCVAEQAAPMNRAPRGGRTSMSKAVLSMSMSVDGFIAGPHDGPGNGLGDGGHRLHAWFLPDADTGHQEAVGRLDGVNREVMDEIMSTGAVVVGRRTFELAGGWDGDHHDGVPI